MTSSLEQALTAFLEGQLAPDHAEVDFEPGAIAATIEPGRQRVVALGRDCHRQVAHLYYGLAAVVVETPVVAGLTEQSHAEMVADVEFVLRPRVDQDHGQADVDAIVAARGVALEAKGFGDDGIWVEGPRDRHEERAWRTEIGVKLGLSYPA